MIKKILGILAVLVAIFAVVVALQPSEFRVSRSASFSAPPAIVFAQVNDLHSWQNWSPWAKLDPNAKITFEGPDAGVGAAFAWAGNKQVGEGKMTIVESRPAELVRFQLDFTKPFRATNSTEFVFKPEGDRTLITWSMSGKKTFLFKAMGLFMNCDKMMGDDFEKGFANLKSLVETAPNN